MRDEEKIKLVRRNKEVFEMGKRWIVVGLVVALVTMACGPCGLAGLFAPSPPEEVEQTDRHVIEIVVSQETPPEPTPVPPAPTPVPPEPTPRSQTEAVDCMTDSEVRALFGFGRTEIVRTDAPWDLCKWNRQNQPSTISFVLHEGWGLTYTDLDDNVWVTIGRGQTITARGFTLRQPGNQFLALGPTGYFNKEWEFGYEVERGADTYPHCPDENMVDLVTLTSEQQRLCNQQAGGVPPVVDISEDQFPGCPSQTTDWYAANIGGPVSKWSEPDWAEGAWVFEDKGYPVSLEYPGLGVLNVWIGDGPVSITSENAGLLERELFDECSFHCQ